MTLLVIIFYAFVGFLEISSLKKQNKKKELILYSFVFLTAFTLSILLSMGIKIPSPAKPIEDAVDGVKSIFK